MKRRKKPRKILMQKNDGFNKSIGEKPISSANLGEIKDTLKEAQYNLNLKNKLIQEYLEIYDVEKIDSISELFSTYEKRVLGVAFDDFLKSKGYKIERGFSGEGNEIFPFEYENTEVEFKKFKKVINVGTLLISNKNLKLALNIDYYGQDSTKVEILVNEKDSKDGEKFLRELKTYSQENNYLRGKKITPDLKFLEVSKAYTWDSVILDPKIKKKTMLNVETILKNLEIYRINKIQFKRGIIFKGEPGVGKTLIGKILLNITDVSTIWVTPRHLERSSTISSIGAMARELSPTILFLEDIDLYGESRESNNHKTLLGELMNQLDGIEENKNIIVIATTNRGDELEKALRNRPGRFDAVIEITKPGAVEREKMLNLYTDRFTSKDLNLKEIADKTDGYTGAHVKDLVDLAVMTAIDEQSLDKEKKIILKQSHLSSNIKKVGKKKMEIGFNSATPSSESAEAEY